MPNDQCQMVIIGIWQFDIYFTLGKYKEKFHFSLLLGNFFSSLESGNFPRL